MKRFSFILGLMFLCQIAYSQVIVRMINPNIHSGRVRYAAQRGEAAGSIPRRPYLTLSQGGIDGEDEWNSLEISFDELSHDPKLYSYQVVHLNPDGRPSALQSTEYLRGFTSGDIDEGELSMNTSQNYTHYSFFFPNQQMQLTASGRYRLQIYEGGNPSQVVMEVEFLVVEPLVQIQPTGRTHTSIETSGRYQGLDIEVTFNQDCPMKNTSDYHIEVYQNNRLDNARIAPKPTYVDMNRLRWINSTDLEWEGGNEYRHFDAYSTYYAGTGVDRIRYELGSYNAFLEKNTIRSGSYIYDYDTNGQFLINAERTSDVDTEAEYMWVHFQLLRDEPWLQGGVYILGDGFGNQPSIRNRMEYDYSAHAYYLDLLLKQGAYDYLYAIGPKGQKETTLQLTEGSYWQTENTYTILVWYHPFGSRAYRLVGFQAYSSSSR